MKSDYDKASGNYRPSARNFDALMSAIGNSYQPSEDEPVWSPGQEVNRMNAKKKREAEQRNNNSDGGSGSDPTKPNP